MVPHTIVLEPLSECLILGACAAWAASTLSGGSIDPYAFYMIHVLVWFLLDWILLNVMQVYYIFIIYFNFEFNIAYSIFKIIKQT